MTGPHPLKQILLDSRPYWDHPGTPDNIRENFLKVIDCGTLALGAEVFASESETKLVCHTCKSRLCTSCGHRATEEWQGRFKCNLTRHTLRWHNTDNAGRISTDSQTE